MLLVPGTVLALSGVFLVMTQGTHVSWQSFASLVQSNPAAYSMALGAAVSWALYSNLARRWSGAGGQGGADWFIAATGVVLVLLRLVWREQSAWSGRAALEVAVLGGVTGLAYVLWDAAMRKGNLLLVAACSYLTPLLSTLVSCAYLHVAPSGQLWAGCGLLVVGSLVSWRSVAGGE